MSVENYSTFVIHALLVSGSALPMPAEARTQMAMPEREHVQTIVWIMEATTFVTVLVVVWFLRRLIKRDQARRKARQDD
ncbi:MAG: hypothetical protein HKM01_07115 [Gallionella sp.]|jgi:heme/copper-type cytochrome/quinol oxidase subunit 2|nr:hypothetical protein [Gallionella sp.]